LRGGDYTNGIGRLESFCYSSAVALMKQPNLRSNVVGEWFRADLVKYRNTFSNSPGERYPTEDELDSLLRKASDVGK
jgi:hypothetical protein